MDEDGQPPPQDFVRKAQRRLQSLQQHLALADRRRPNANDLVDDSDADPEQSVDAAWANLLELAEAYSRRMLDDAGVAPLGALVPVGSAAQTPLPISPQAGLGFAVGLVGTLLPYYLAKDNLHLQWLYAGSLIKSALKLKTYTNTPGFTLGALFEEKAKTFPGNVALYFEESQYTFRQMNQAANRIAHWGHALQLKPGDVVALMMENRPEFYLTWIGLAKLGVVTAFINYRLLGASLKHVLQTANAKKYIIGSELLDSFSETFGTVADPKTVYVYKGAHGPSVSKAGVASLDELLAKSPDTDPPVQWRQGASIEEDLWYIYTSGTTGLPKAAKVTNKNTINRMLITSNMLELTAKDRMYVTLPLYHSSGSVIGSSVWINGGAIVLRTQFSAKEFWNDCRRYRATAFVYIGEICRYLQLQPPQPNDGQHQLRICMGNGLRPDIWAKFQKRFAVPKIVEFYGSTEGSSVVNLANEVGAVGFVPWPARLFIKSNVLVRYDVDADQYVKGPDGFLVLCKPNEVGELVCKLEDDAQSSLASGGQFRGYTDASATEKKILHNVFEKGDKYFRTGDLLKQDERGFYYFVDRIGDTYRWKGENVSTTEVAEVLTMFPAVEEAVVYGVQVPGYEGRAGMACLVLKKGASVDFAALYRLLEQQLPAYAQPLFLRVASEVHKTSTFKYQKGPLVKDGFDPEQTSDALYMREPAKHTFVPMTVQLHSKIVRGELRV